MDVFLGDTFLFSAASSVGGKEDVQDGGIGAGSQGGGDSSTSSALKNVEGGEAPTMETTLPYSSLVHVDASFLSTFIASFFVIICSELGDKVRPPRFCMPFAFLAWILIAFFFPLLSFFLCLSLVSKEEVVDLLISFFFSLLSHAKETAVQMDYDRAKRLSPGLVGISS